MVYPPTLGFILRNLPGRFMMWILPKQLLDMSPFAQDMGALTLDSGEFSRLAEQSLMWRSKPSPARTWLQRWKRVNWMRHLSGQTLKPCHTKSFSRAWTLSLAVTRANPSQQQASEKEKKTHDTSGHSFKGQLGLFDQDTASLRTSKDSLPSALKTYATTWVSWVTSLRQEYSVRLNAAHLTREKECSSWPTPTSAEGSKIGSQANYGQVGLSNHPAIVGLPDREKLNKSGKSQGLPETAGPQNSSMKLNPSWVEQLQGLPVGWTQLPTGWTVFASSETESSPPPVK